MASHAPQTITFVTNDGSVMSNGRSTRLAKGQLGIVDLGASPTAAGLAVVNSFPTTPQDRKFELRLGISPLTPTRSQSDKSYSSRPFTLDEIVDIRVVAPKIGGTVDELIIGYDGINANTAIQLENGDNEVIDITLSGEGIGMLGYADATVTVKLYLEAPNEGEFTNEQIILEAVERFKKITLLGGVPITTYIDIAPVDSSNPATVTGESQVFQSIVVVDNGNSAALGKLQAEYPLYDIKRESYSVGASKYVTITDEGVALPDFSVSVYSQDGDCGEPDCEEIATNTYEWVEGETCTAVGKVYTIQLKDDDCNGGNLAALQAAYPDLTITVATSSANVQRTATLSGTSGDASLVVGGTTYTTTFVTSPTATAAAFVTAHASAIATANPGTVVTSSGAGIVFRAPATSFPTITAVAGGMTETLGAIVSDSTGTATEGACQTVYQTVVYSDLVCEDCDPVFRDLFVTEAPKPYKFTDWVPAPSTFDEDALMGIKITGKNSIFAGSEEYRDSIPFVYSPVRISVANEAPGTVNQSYKVGTNGRFAVKLLSIASVPEALGMNFLDQEERTRVYYEDRPRLAGNNYGKLVLGQETLLKPTTQYVDYAVRISTSRFSQAFSRKNTDNIEYHILVDACNHADVETLINALATAAGLPTVQAYNP